MKIDLHLHSKYSDKPVHWLAEYYPESLVEIDDIYKTLMDRGMSYATLTDHNCIGGCLELVSKYPQNTFISCEFDVTFPEDGCNVHIPVYNITEQQFEDLSTLRRNIYDFKKYLNEHKLPHTVAHMFYSVNDRLKVHHVEKLLLMFKTFELNGSRSKRMNDSLSMLLDSLTPAIMDELTAKHDMVPAPEAWIKFRTGGSDDHSGLKAAGMHTKTPDSKDLQEFFTDVFQKGKGTVSHKYGGPESLAHSMHSIAYQQLKTDFNLKHIIASNQGFNMVNQLLSGEKSEHGKFARMISAVLVSLNKGRISSQLIEMLNNTISQNPDIIKTVAAMPEPEAAWMHMSEAVFSSVAKNIIEEGIGHIKQRKFLRLEPLFGKTVGLSLVSSPYFISYSITNRDEQFAKKALRKITKIRNESKSRPRVLAFSDTFDDINGVALTMRMQLEAAEANGLDYAVLTCSANPKTKYENEVRFKPVLTQEVPFYSELSLVVPPFLQILDYCYKYNPSYIIAETEGLMGLSAIGVGYILNKPVYSVYHTQFPQFVGAITGKSSMEEMTWDYIKFFHAQTHAVWAPSNWIKDDLVTNGVDRKKIVVYPRGIDLSLFKTMSKSADANPGKTRFIYVGRVSKEKGLDLLGKAYNNLYAENSNIELDIIGDGPYREEFQQSLASTNARFLGYLKGEELVQAYNNANVFVFPSATDTWGNVVLEAQACGLPVIVTDKGGPQENLILGKTGMLFEAGDAEGLRARMRFMMDKNVAAEFSANAVEYMKGRSFHEAFLKFYDMVWEDYQERGFKKRKISSMGMKDLIPGMRK